MNKVDSVGINTKTSLFKEDRDQSEDLQGVIDKWFSNSNTGGVLVSQASNKEELSKVIESSDIDMICIESLQILRESSSLVEYLYNINRVYAVIREKSERVGQTFIVAKNTDEFRLGTSRFSTVILQMEETAELEKNNLVVMISKCRYGRSEVDGVVLKVNSVSNHYEYVEENQYLLQEV